MQGLGGLLGRSHTVTAVVRQHIAVGGWVAWAARHGPGQGPHAWAIVVEDLTGPGRGQSAWRRCADVRHSSDDCNATNVRVG